MCSGTPDTIRILGVPWRVVEVGRFEESDRLTQVCTEACELRMCKDIVPSRWASHLFWLIMRALSEALTYGDTIPDKDEQDNVYFGIWGALRDVWPVAKRWFAHPPTIEPCRLRFHGFDWVLEVPDLIPDEPKATRGLCNTNDGTLYVRSGLDPYRQAVVLLEELMHGALRPFSTLWDNEQYVRPMAAGLAQVFFDNPDVLPALFGTEGETS